MNFNEYFSLIKEGECEKAELVRQAEIPPKLIKFVWLDGRNTSDDKKKLASLEKKTLWFSHISSVNDPYELQGMILDKEKLRAAGYPEKVISSYEKGFSFEEFGITCLSGNAFDYLPMWAYYTNNYKGYCVEYDVIKKDCIHKVCYEPERIPFVSLIFQFGQAINMAMDSGEIRTRETEFYTRIFLQKLFIKSKHWEHEKEYRIAYPIKNNVGENVPISKLGLRTSKIIAGINCPEKIVQKLNQISINIGCGPAYRTNLSETKYSLVEERLSEDFLPNKKGVRWRKILYYIKRCQNGAKQLNNIDNTKKTHISNV